MNSSLTGYDTYNSGYNTRSNQQSYAGGQYGYGTWQPDQASSAYNHQSPSGSPPDTRERHDGTGYGTHSLGYNIQSNQHNYTSRPNGYGPSGQSYQNPAGNVQQVFQQQNDDQSGYYTNRSGNSASQYTSPSSFHKEHVAGVQQSHASQAYWSPYTANKDDIHRNHPGHFMNVNTDVQRNRNGMYQEKHLDNQPITPADNNMSSTPYQDSMYPHSLPGSLPNNGSTSQVSDEASGTPKGTIEELDKLCEEGKVKEAMEVLPVLREKGIILHAPQYFKLMQACADASALGEAREIHHQICQSELAADTDVNNKILDMYAKCASMEDAKKLFSTMALHDLTSWSTIIAGFVHNGLGEEATDFFDQFKQTGDKPDPCMFTHVFLACGILGSVDEGMLHFESMQKDFGITPDMDHYASIVNMLGQSGYLDEAREFVERMPMEPSIDVWESLMNMCRLNGSLELGDRCAQIIERLDPSRLNEQSKMGLFPVNASDLAKEKERKKANSVEARSKVHEYRAGDRSHPETLKIYEELRYLAAHMKEAGYVADTRFVLHDVDPETKEDALLAHSERLAVSYGLITSAARAPIRVIKNLRSCGDCHTALKIISKLVGRQIIARDAKRFHHFENGVCSCKDYW
jgi:pentatricopeptide repeat protein